MKLRYVRRFCGFKFQGKVYQKCPDGVWEVRKQPDGDEGDYYRIGKPKKMDMNTEVKVVWYLPEGSDKEDACFGLEACVTMKRPILHIEEKLEQYEDGIIPKI